MSKFKTPNGKDITTRISPQTAMWIVQFDQGGSLPERLWGFFTSERLADKAVQQYLSGLKPKKEDNGS